MNFQELQVLLDYHYWARDRMFSAVEKLSSGQYHEDLGGSFKSIHDTIVHFYSAESVWCSRWLGEAPGSLSAAGTFADLHELRTAWAAHETTMRAFLESLGPAGVDRVIEYKSFAGIPSKQPYWQMLQHVVNHASYHRGQVTMMIRQLKAAPPESMDLITYYREHVS